ncbi:hypothetical protein N9165_00575 [Akkermansiaceae bacterium]|nr:hypothetical protein [Akkermansiaceae bacterium]
MEFSRAIHTMLKASGLVGVDLRCVSEFEVERPYQQLLCHDRDMTSTLGDFHEGEVSLKVLKEYLVADLYMREVVLSVDEKPVEYGLIEIHLQEFPDDLRERIVSKGEPLGNILNTSGLSYRSEPSSFFAIKDSDFTPDFFPVTGGGSLFGRYNTLLNPEDRILANILEILPREHS